MKRWVFCLVALLCFGVPAFPADVDLNIVDLEYTEQDSLLSLSLEMVNTVGVFGIQCDITDTPDFLEYKSFTSLLPSSWTAGVGEPNDSSARVLIYSIFGDSIQADTTYTFINLVFRIKGETINSGVKIVIENIVISDRSGTSYESVSGDTATVNIVMSTHPEVTELPRLFQLNQNYPNPFNPSTTITYRIPEVVSVQLSVFNVKGELVRTLIRKDRFAGYGRVEWNGLDDRGQLVPSGVYIYQMIAGDYTESRKMLLIH